MHGGGVSLVLLPEALEKFKGCQHAHSTPEMQAAIDGLKNQGVQFGLCANTLQGRKVDRNDHLYMVGEADIVPSGVVGLGILQSQGFAHIKP